jgi:hypothetical protein
MFKYVNEGAILMCTGCPGVPAKLDATKARTVSTGGNIQATEADKKITQPGFGMCVAIPTAPKKCSPNLGEWFNTKSDVIKKGKKALLFPNGIPCMSGPGLITMTSPGSQVESIGATKAKEEDKDCKWETCEKKHEFKIDYPKNGITVRKDLGTWLHPSLIYAGAEQVYRTDPLDGKDHTNYETRKHHVIPVKIFEHVPLLCKNLELLGYDINNEFLNGMTLCYRQKDLVWHDLQYHRGNHQKYSGVVKEKMSLVQTQSEKLCTTDDQTKLFEIMSKEVKRFREKILNWSIELQAGAKDTRDSVFSSESIARSAPLLGSRKYFC